MNMLAHIADRVLGRPLFIHQGKAAMILAVLGERIGVEADAAGVDEVFKALASSRPQANRLIGEPAGPINPSTGRMSRMYNLAGGVAMIPVVGSLVNRGAYVGASSGVTSYEGLSAAVEAAVADPRVGAIMLDIDSPGGEATGMFALAETIRRARQQKPVTALVDDMAASAAYGIASAADEIVVSPTSISGSIGVVLMHVDQSKEMEMKGRKATLIHAGAHKVDGNPLGPLSDEVRADLQREVNTFYDQFVQTVAAGRPKLSEDAIRNTEARVYIGEEALKLGLADRVGTFAETLMRVSSEGKKRLQLKQKGITMTNENDIITRAEHLSAVAAAVAEARLAALAEGAAAATARIRTILTCPEAAGREATAQVFALDSDMSAEVAIKALSAVPVATPAAVPPLAERGAPPVGQGQPGQIDAAAFWGGVVDASNASAKARHNFGSKH